MLHGVQPNDTGLGRRGGCRAGRSSPTPSACASSARSWSRSSSSALDQTVVGTALPTIITDLGGNGLYTWAFTAYLLTATISGPLYGKISDLFGRRPVFLFGISVFMLGSVLAGLSPGDVAAGRRARHPGPRRRRDLPARDGDRSPTCSRRPSAAGTRACSARCSAVEPARPGHRRPDHRHHRLAVRVLRQHPDRRSWSCSRSGATCPPTTSAATSRRSTTSARRCSRARWCRSSSASPTSSRPTGPTSPSAA